MQTYWIKFTDGSDGYCQGESAYDAVSIAQHITGKTADVENKYQPDKSQNVQINPYPVHGRMIWQFEHPRYGKVPGFCHGGRECRGLTSCPQRRACDD